MRSPAKKEKGLVQGATGMPTKIRESMHSVTNTADGSSRSSPQSG